MLTHEAAARMWVVVDLMRQVSEQLDDRTLAAHVEAQITNVEQLAIALDQKTPRLGDTAVFLAERMQKRLDGFDFSNEWFEMTVPTEDALTFMSDMGLEVDYFKDED